MEEKLYLYPAPAPYTAECGGQAQPSLKAFTVFRARGAVVVCPGGAYRMKAAHEGDPIARMLNSQGISAFVLDYRVAPCPYEAPLSDAKRALRMVRALGYQMVGILGFSAGGNLCCSAATLFDAGDPESPDPIERFTSRPDAFIPCYPVASFGEYTHMGSREALLGDKKDDPELVRRFSAECNVTDRTPPAFIWHTSQDELVPVQNSLLLGKALADHHIPFELHIYPRGRHGLGLAEEFVPVSGWTSDLCRWLLNLGFGA